MGAQTAEPETRELAALFHHPRPTTIEILAHRELNREGGHECVDWAVGMLERGYESGALSKLAGLTPPLHPSDVCSLRDRALEELRPPELSVLDPVNSYVAELVFEAIYNSSALRDTFARVSQLATELGHPGCLEPFFNLHFAAENLGHSDVQWSWPGATRENIDEIMLQEARRFVARYAR